MPFPEIYSHPERGDTFGVEVASGDGALLDTLRTALDNNEAATFASLSLVLDTDLQTEAERFAAFRSKIDAWNAQGLKDERPGFPLAFPDHPNAVVAGAPRVGIYLLPGDGEQGTLETILLACAAHRHPDLHARALALITQTDESFPTDADPDPLKALRRGSGRAKAHCGVIGNVFKPGASLSVSLRETAWLPEIEADVPSFAARRLTQGGFYCLVQAKIVAVADTHGVDSSQDGSGHFQRRLRVSIGCPAERFLPV